MKDIDRANILDGLVIEIVFGKVEKSGVEKPSFRGGDIIISPPGTDRVKILIILGPFFTIENSVSISANA